MDKKKTIEWVKAEIEGMKPCPEVESFGDSLIDFLNAQPGDEKVIGKHRYRTNVKIDRQLMREARLRLQLRQEDLAEMMDYSPSRITQFERGLTDVPRQAAEQLAEILFLSIDTFILGEGEDNIRKKEDVVPREIPQVGDRVWFNHDSIGVGNEIIGIALNNARNGEEVNVLRQGTLTSLVVGQEEYYP